MNLGFLAKETCIGLNKIFLGLRRFTFYPRYFVAVNPKVISQSVSQIQALNCVKFIGLRGAEFLSEGALTYHINTRLPPKRFCEDITLGVHDGSTVTYAALQIAYFLGFHQVTIIGLDHRYDFSGAPNAASFIEGADPNHFSTEYFSGHAWDNPDLARSEESYRIARKVFEADGRRILDATVNGACNVFEKVDYREHFGVSA